MSDSKLRQMARKLTGTEATVRNLADHLRAERELVQAQADRLHGRTHETLLRLAASLDRAGETWSEDCAHLLVGIEGALDGAAGRIETGFGQVMEKLSAIEAGVEEAIRTGESEPAELVREPDPEPTELLQSKSIFCVGSARSGTTILMHCLNDHPRVHIVGECNSYRHEPGQDFRKVYNRRMAEVGNPRFKGTWLPNLGVEPSDPGRYFAALARSFDLVGEKLAFGPETGLGLHIENFLEWQGRHYLRSVYLCTIREPRACVWSMTKMFPKQDRRHICRTWLLTAALVLDLYRNFPNSYVIFNESFSLDTVARIGRILGVEFDLPRDMISLDHVRTRIGDDSPEALIDIETELAELEEVYVEMRACFDPATLREDRSRFMIPMFGALRRKMDKVLGVFDERDKTRMVGPSQLAKVETAEAAR